MSKFLPFLTADTGNDRLLKAIHVKLKRATNFVKINTFIIIKKLGLYEATDYLDKLNKNLTAIDKVKSLATHYSTLCISKVEYNDLVTMYKMINVTLNSEHFTMVDECQRELYTIALLNSDSIEDVTKFIKEDIETIKIAKVVINSCKLTNINNIKISEDADTKIAFTCSNELKCFLISLIARKAEVSFTPVAVDDNEEKYKYYKSPYEVL